MVSKKNIETTYFEGGEKKSETEYFEGNITKYSCFWRSNGQKEGEINYKVDSIEGSTWFENGQIKHTGSTLNEKNDNGELSQKRIGEWKWWDDKGNLLETANYKNFVLHGHRTFYNEKGQITLFQNYKNGEILHDKDNELIEPFGDGELIQVALFLLKGLPNPSHGHIDILSESGSTLLGLISYLKNELWSKYCAYDSEDIHAWEKASNEVDAFIKILQYRLFANPKLKYSFFTHDVSFTKEELGIDHHRD